jgi:Glyoxalase-like domain
VSPAAATPTATLDHLVVAAATLAEGVAWCEAVLGITPGPGGEHPLMGTHNRLFKLGCAAADHPTWHPTWHNAYFEIIAINPAAPAPNRPRWFGLDEPALQSRLRSHGPQLIHWVAASTSLVAHRSRLLAAGQLPGDVLDVSRPTATGLLRWQMLVPADGVPRCAGALPTLIEWPAGVHPATAMPASGVALHSLQLRGVPAAALQALALQGVHAATDTPTPPLTPALRAVLHTPLGAVTLES